MSTVEPPDLRALAQEGARELGYSRLELRDVSGKSGATTFRAYPTGPAGRATPVVLKVGPAEVIDRDLSGLELARRYYADANHVVGVATVPAANGAPGSGAFKVLVLTLVDGETFEEFYLRPETTPDAVSAALASLFAEKVRVVDVNVKKEWNPFSRYVFHDPARHSRALRAAGDGLPTLVRWWERAAAAAQGLPGHACLVHGDLHRRNLLVSGGRARPVDFGLTLEEGHALRDFAKLERDVRLFLYPREAGDDPAGADALDRAVEGEAGGAPALRKAAAAVRAVRDASRRLQVETWDAEYPLALLAQYVFAAGDESLPPATRRLALRYAHQQRRELERLHPELAIPPAERVRAHRGDLLWRYAYAFFRLDQLPSGGWSRSLPAWLEALTEGDDGTFTLHPHTRTQGGTDLTCSALLGYLRLLRRVDCHRPDGAGRLRAREGVLRGILDNLGQRSLDGGVGVGKPGKAGPAVVAIRHTAMGLLACLSYAAATGTPPLKLIGEMYAYLGKHLGEWRKDTMHLFGAYCVLARLRELLDTPAARELGLPALDGFLRKLDRALAEMDRELVQPTPPFPLRPEGTCTLDPQQFPAAPYAGLWRMERSNLLMYLPLLVGEDGESFHPFVSRTLLRRCMAHLGEVMDAVATAGPGDGGRLPYYHRAPYPNGRQRAPLDCGLGAELLAVLGLPAVRRQLHEHLPGRDPERLAQALRAGLEASFDAYGENQNLFKFTHGAALGRALDAAPDDLLHPDALAELDREIARVVERGVTELDLHELCTALVAGASAGLGVELPASVPAVRDLLVDKLAAGEHVVDGDAWQARVKEACADTIRYYDGPGGTEYAASYAQPYTSFVTGITALVRGGGGPLRALDVGCGPGQYAELLQQAGYQVELSDASREMLRLAARRLGRDPAGLTPLRADELLGAYGPGSFDLVFACALLVHVPRASAPDLLRAFHEMLRPGGALFVNVKIGDHSLIGMGGRYYQYYRDPGDPLRMLEAAGFVIPGYEISRNAGRLDGSRKAVQWANFYCTRQCDAC